MTMTESPAQTSPADELAPKLLAEFIGTFAFVFIGAGAAAVVGDGAGMGGIGAIAIAHGLTIMVFAYAYGEVSGGHFNPDTKKHGMQNPDGPHAGDMPNFTVDAKGTSKATVMAPGITMGSDSHSIFSNGGTALMIHAKADDMKTDPTGNAGDRIACGVIMKQ